MNQGKNDGKQRQKRVDYQLSSQCPLRRSETTTEFRTSPLKSHMSYQTQSLYKQIYASIKRVYI